jgi:hypothetical protein
MKIDLLFSQIPLLFLFVITVGFVFLSIVGGYYLGNYIRSRKNEKGTSLGSIIGAMLGLLAFILAFTFGIASSRFDARKQLLLDQTNALGTAFLRTDFLADPQGTETRKLLRKYVDILVEGGQHREKLPQALVDSDLLLDQLWYQVTALRRLTNDSIMLGLYVQSLNEVIDIHAKRVMVALQYRISGSIWLVLYFVTMLTMFGVGYDFGLNGSGSFLISLVLAFSFSAVILVIADLDRAVEGLLKVSQQPMIELQQKLNSPAK